MLIDILAAAAAPPRLRSGGGDPRLSRHSAGRRAGQFRLLFRGRLLAAPVGRPGQRRRGLGDAAFRLVGGLAGWAERVTKRRWLQPALYAVPFDLVSALIVLPWALYAEYYREKQYGLMNLSLGGWLGERAILLGISLVVTAILLADRLRRHPQGAADLVAVGRRRP